jgi:hypothetical protein
MAGVHGTSGVWGGIVAPVPGVNETPRMTCPLVGAMTVLKLSPEGSDVAPRLSVIDTRAFGSAPWSPLQLTVEVAAQMLTVVIDRRTRSNLYVSTTQRPGLVAAGPLSRY